MELSLREAARLLGKSERQVRYMIQQGRLKATKAGKSWRIARSDLPISDTQITRGLADQARLAGVVETALGSSDSAPQRKRYSVTDLRAFQAARAVAASLRQALGAEAAATRRMDHALALLACGCHTFHKRDKLAYLQQAREQICYALASLLLSPDEQVQALAAPIEAELLPALGGFMRAAERRR